MANTSIKSAFERMWGHTTNALANKANSADLGDLATKDTIEKTDLASDIQVSLGKADTAVQTLAGYATEDYVSTAISQIPTPDVSGQISTHNTATDAHNDIRLLVEGLTTRLNALANSDDTTLDQMAEVVAYIKSNRGLIEGITTSKVNVADIIDNLTTNVGNKPLSAAQGVALKALIDAIVIPTKVSDLTNDSGYITGYTETDPTVPAWAKAASKPTYTASEVGLGNVNNTSDANKPVSTAQATAIADAKKAGTDAQSNLAGHIDNKNNPHGVTAAQVGAVPTSRKVNGKELSTDVTLSASDIGLSTENWTFTLEDGSTVTKAVYVG